MPMPNTQRIQKTTNPCMSLSKNDVQQCEVRLVRDPLFILKTENVEHQPATSTLTLSESRETAAEVFIEALSKSTERKSKETDPEIIRSRARSKYRYVELSTTEKTNNSNQNDKEHIFTESFDDAGNKHLIADETIIKKQDKYTCNICDDICTNLSEFKQHLEFHLELHKSSNKATIVTKEVAVDKASSQIETFVPVTDCSQPSQTALNNTLDETGNSNSNEHTDLLETDISPTSGNILTEKFCQSNKCSSTTSSLPIVDNANASAVVKSSTKRKEMKLRSSTSTIKKRTPVLSLTPENSSSTSSLPTADNTNIDSLVESTETEAIKSHSRRSVRKGAKPGVSSTPDCLKDLPVNRNLPKIPIRKCDCLLQKLDTKCELCTQPPTYACGNCKKEFKSFTELQEHVVDDHSFAKYFCQECGQGYSKTFSLKQHTDRHKGLLTCYLCISSFGKKQELEEHILTHRIKCDQCDKICSSSRHLSTHKLEVHKGVTYTCEACNKTFNKYDVLRSHKTRHHRKGQFKCKECDKVYEKLSSYFKHVNRHRQQKQVFCEQCGKEFQSVRYLKIHQTTVHLQKKYICDVCKKEFSSTTGRTNCQNKHAGIAKYKCDMCDKAYFYAGSLLIHKRIHTGAKPYVCFVCGRRFYSDQMLLKHCLSHNISEKDIRKKMRSAYQPEKQKRITELSNEVPLDPSPTLP